MNGIYCFNCGPITRVDQRVNTPGRAYYELRDGKLVDIGADSSWDCSDYEEFICAECGGDLPHSVQIALGEMV